MIKRTAKQPALIVWLILMAITAISWMTAEFSDNATTNANHVAIGLFMMATFKVRLVMMHFMEVKTAPFALRVICDVWLFLTCGAMIAAYLTDITL